MATGDGATTALVLSGGVAYAAYEVGVMKALFQGKSPITAYQPLHADVFTGISAGSLNAAIMASQPGVDSASTVDYLEHVWVNEIAYDAKRCRNGALRFRGSLWKFLSPECLATNPFQPVAEFAEDAAYFARDWFQRAVQFATTPASLGRRMLELIDPSSFISIESLRELLPRVLSLEGIRRSEKILRFSATSWQTGQLRIFRNEDMTDRTGYQAILGATAFPGLEPVEVDGQLYVDGAFVANQPLSPAIHAGATILHVIYMDPDPPNVQVRRLYNVVDVLDKTYASLMASIFELDIKLVNGINRGLVALEGAGNGGQDDDAGLRVLTHMAGNLRNRGKKPWPYKKITIHQYHPEEDLGGVLGILNFERDHVIGLIEPGFQDAQRHDCSSSECVLTH
jgi:NTE family protein